METVKTSGYILEKEGERFISISNGVCKIKLGDTVISNGRIFAPKGTKGIVVEIDLPFVVHRTVDVIAVEWESEPGCSSFMKFKDLNFEVMANL